MALIMYHPVAPRKCSSQWAAELMPLMVIRPNMKSAESSTRQRAANSLTANTPTDDLTVELQGAQGYVVTTPQPKYRRGKRCQK